MYVPSLLNLPPWRISVQYVADYAVYGVTQSRTRLKQLSSSSSRKMVLMNLFAGQQWRCRHKEQTYGHGGDREERVGQMERVAWKHIHYHM